MTSRWKPHEKGEIGQSEYNKRLIDFGVTAQLNVRMGQT